MLKRITGLAAGITLIAGLFVASPAAAAAPDGEIQVSYIVPTRHADIYLEVIHPTKGGKILPAPLILTYSPYSILGRNGDSSEWVPNGYARGYADVVGTGNSGGCYDYGGKREKETGYDIVEWIAKQKWNNGKIAMMGGSYDGTTANATAVMKPPHLTTIIPEAAISRWYGYAFSGGIRYLDNNEWVGNQGPGAITDEGFDTPLAFDFGLALPPPLDVQDPTWASRVESTITPCDELTHTQYGYDDTPDYDDFWLERDYLKDAAKVEIPVLVAGNWGDWNVKQEESWNWFRALKNSEKAVLYEGTRWDGHGTPGTSDYGVTVHKWMDHYLMGQDNGIENMPSVVTQTSDQSGPGKWFNGAPRTRNVVLYVQQAPMVMPGTYGWQLLTTKPRVIPSFGQTDQYAASAAFPSTNVNTESHALHHGQSNHDWFWFESPLLKKDMRIFGQPKVQVYFEIQREWVTITPTLADANPADHVIQPPAGHVATTNKAALVGVTRGWLDTRYRDGLDQQVMFEPGKPLQVTVDLKPTDYTFAKGHYLGLNIQTEINEWSLPKLYPGCDGDVPDPTQLKKQSCSTFTINWAEARTRVILPVVDAPKNPASLFDVGHANHGMI